MDLLRFYSRNTLRVGGATGPETGYIRKINPNIVSQHYLGFFYLNNFFRMQLSQYKKGASESDYYLLSRARYSVE